MLSPFILANCRAQYSGRLIVLLFEPRVYSFFVTHLTVVHGYKELYEVNSTPPKKCQYPEYAASVVMSRGPHDASHVVNGFSGNQVRSPRLPLSSSRKFILRVCTFSCFICASYIVSHYGQVLHYSSK